MSEARRQLGYRIADDRRAELEAVARQERTTLQGILDRAVESFLNSRLSAPATDLLRAAGLTAVEVEFIHEMLWFHRNAGRETVRDVRSMVKVMRRAAEASGRVAAVRKAG